MSGMVAHTGRLVEIEMYDHMCIESYLEHIFRDEKGIKDMKGCDTWTEYAMFYEGTYHVHKDKLYKIKEHRNLMEDDDGLVAKRNKDNDVEFAVLYYNGGWGLDEALDAALDKLEEEEK